MPSVSQTDLAMPEIKPIYRFIVAHVVPGAVAVYPVALFSPTVADLARSCLSRDATFAGLTAILGVALVLGLLVDGLSSVTCDFVVDWVRTRWLGQPAAIMSPKSMDDLAFIEQVNATFYAWKQCYASLALVFAFMSGSVLVGHSSMSRWWTLAFLALAALFIVASARSSKNNEALLAGKFEG
jgi:hypothetical protein